MLKPGSLPKEERAKTKQNKITAETGLHQLSSCTFLWYFVLT